MRNHNTNPSDRGATFSLRALFFVTAAFALIMWAGMTLRSAWQKREIVTAMQPNQVVSVFDGHLGAIAAACPSIQKITVDHRTNSVFIVCQYRHSATARQELIPYLSNPQLLETAEILKLPLSEVLAMSKGD